MSTPKEQCPEIDRERLRDLPQAACEFVMRSDIVPMGEEDCVYRAQAIVLHSGSYVERVEPPELRVDATIQVVVRSYRGTTHAGVGSDAVWMGTVEVGRVYRWEEQAHPGVWNFGALARPDEIRLTGGHATEAAGPCDHKLSPPGYDGCPSCGSTALALERLDVRTAQVVCRGCGARGPAQECGPGPEWPIRPPRDVAATSEELKPENDPPATTHGPGEYCGHTPCTCVEPADPVPCSRCGAVQGYVMRGEHFHCRVCDALGGDE